MPEDLPELIGWQLEEAKRRLASLGRHVEVKQTSSPRHKPRGRLRVIRQRAGQNGSVELTVAAHPEISPTRKEQAPDAGSSLQTSIRIPDADEAEQDLISRIDPARVPKHVAIIMDGNGRWAKERGLPRIMGHHAGRESVRSVVKDAPDLGIQSLTLYAFSAENWRRPSAEVVDLMELMAGALHEELPELKRQGVALRTLGRPERLPEKVREEFQHAYEETKDNRRLFLNIALNYSGRWEILDAAKRLAERVKSGELAVEDIDEEHLASMLYLPDTPDPDLLIRTSGEHRISNYLLWQIAYTEIYVTPVLWPDFRRIHLLEAVLDYQQRKRRFGAVNSSPGS
ncbi:MAG: isoprenyl transferase [Armatimonadetes bacterium]|nr:isoprenyl transferase [Armatimonadota bacterium]NIM22990.1 isoprenyl transferase [Armatimonadota bacterium]NIM66861.1 isoprenyl transferase [Armatimonadota bacterium]NIM75401.1 isoprenyl transferase [Armatimonadota bacterium]NIN05048.1 isoprenyl transferase [Armatimonadota bacterium]